jgi:uncharacterized protein (DUF4415 family)
MRDEYDFSKAKKAKKAKGVKVLKSFRLDPDILAWLETEGARQNMGYQTFLNWFLRKNMTEQESLEDRLRKLEQAVFRKR